MSFRKWFSNSLTKNRSPKCTRRQIEVLEDRSTPATLTGGTGPGGFEVANGAATLALWLDATDLNADGLADAIANGSTVNIWTDRSGYNRSATLQLGTPFYVASSTQGANLPAVGFSTAGGNDELLTAFDFDALGANYTIFAVSRYTGGADARVISSQTRNWLFGHHGALDERWHAEGWIHGPGGAGTGTNSQAFNVYAGIIGPAVNGNAADPGADFWKNGVQLTNDNTGSSNTVYKPGRLALGMYGAGNSEASNAEVSEVIIINRAVNEAERRIIQNTLASKYGLAAAAEDVYAGDTTPNGDFDRDAFGIGRLNATNQLLSSGQSGFGIEATSIADDGDWVMAGHKVLSNSFSTAGIPASVNRRFARSWYVDVTDANNNLGATLAFDYSDAGLPQGSANTFRLLRSLDGGASWTDVGVAAAATGDTIKFNVSAVDLSTGLYTLGDGTAPAVVASAGNAFYGLDGGPVTIDPALVVGAGTSTNITSASVTISSGFDAGDILNVTLSHGITVGTNSGGVLTLNGTALTSATDFQDVLRTVTFSASTIAGPRTVTFQVADALGAAGSASRGIIVSTTAANAAVTWDGGGSDFLWTNPLNWSSDVLPDFNDTAVFNGVATGTVNVPSNVTVGNIQFSNNAAPYTLASTGGTITLTGAAILQIGTTNNSITGGIVAASTALTINVAAGTTLTISGPISGSANLNKDTGTGTLELSGANSYTGSTNINAGTLRLAQGIGVPTVPAGAAGIYTFDSVSGTTVTNQGTLGTANNGVLQSGATVGSGGIVGNAMNTTANAGARMEITGTIPITGSWTASAWFNGIFPTTDWRTMFRGNANDHQIIIQSGTNNLGVYDNAGGGAFRDSGFDLPTTVTGWHQIAAVGSGTTTILYLDGVAVGTADRKSATDIFSVGDYQGGSQRFSQRVDEVYIYQTALTPAQVLSLYNATAGLPQATPLNPIPDTSTVNVAAGATFDLNLVSETIGGLGGAGTVTSGVAGAVTLTTGANNANTTFSGVIQNGAGTVSLTKTGAGTMTLGGANTYSGATSILAGTIKLTGGADRLPSTTALTLGSASTAGVLDLADQSQTLTGLTVAGAGLNRVVNSGVGVPSLTLNIASGTNTYAGVLGGPGQNGFTLVKAGAGTLTLTNTTNTFAGGTMITGGILSIASELALGTIPSVAVPGSITITNNARLQITAGITINANRGITLGTGGGTIDTVNIGVTYAGVFSGGGGLTKITSGTTGDLVLTNATAGTNPGTITINGGRLFFNSQNAIGAGAININSGGTLDYNGASALVFANTIAFASGGNIASRTAQLTVSSATLPTTGTIIVNQDDQNTNTVVFPNSIAATGPLTFQVGGGGGNGGLAQFNGVIGGAQVLTKTQNGVLFLNNAGNNFSNTLNVTAGTLRIAADGALGTTAGGTVVAAGATLELNGAFNYTNAEPISIAGAGVGSVGAINRVGGSGSVSAPITFTADAALGSATAGSTNTIAVPVTAGSFNITFAGAGNTTMSASILGGTNLTASGAGTVALNASNNYTGLTTVLAGTVVVGNNAALGAAGGDVVVKYGGTLGFSSNVAITGENITANGPGAAGQAGAIANISGTNSYTGAIVAETVSLGSLGIGSTAGALTIGGTIDLAASRLTLSGAGNVVINSPISGLGVGTSSPDVLRETWYPNLFTDANLFGTGNVPSSYPGYLTQTPASTTSLSATNLSFATAALTARSGIASTLASFGNRFGTVWLGNITVGGSSPLAAGNISLGTNSDDGSTIYVDSNRNGAFEASERVVNNGGGHGATQVIGTVNLAAGTYPFYIGYYEGSGGGSMEARFASGSAIAYGSQTIINPGGAGQVGIWSTSLLVDNSVVKNGAGNATLSGNNTYNGATTVNAGVLAVGANNALGAASAGTTVASGASLAFTNNVNYTTAEPVSVRGTGSGLGAIANLGGTNSTNMPITLAGSTTIGSTAGSLTLNADISAGNYGLTFDGDGNTTVAGNINYVAAPTNSIANLNNLATGDYSFTAASQTFTGHVDNVAGVGWLVIGRGRDGWQFDSDGQGLVSDVSQNLGTSAAFAPAAYSDAIINSLLTQSGIDATNLELRILRATNNANFNNPQDVRWRDFTNPNWTLVISSSSTDVTTGGLPITMEVNTSVLGAGGTFITNTADSNPATPNDYRRVFTWPWSSHGSRRGFAYGTSVGVIANNAASNFFWESGTENHELPYTQISIRMLSSAAITKNGTGTVTLSGASGHSGPTTINAGTLVAANNSALGTTASGTTVASGATLGLAGNVTLSGETLTLNGPGAAGQPGSLVNISGSNAIAASTSIVIPTALGTTATIGSVSGTLTIAPSLDLKLSNLAFAGAGNVVMAGDLGATGNMSPQYADMITGNPSMPSLPNLNTVDYWRLGETALPTVVDSVGSRTGTYTAPTPVGNLNQPGAVSGGNSSVLFGTAGSYASIPSDTALNSVLTGDYTVQFWMFKNSEAGDWQRLVGKGSDSSNRTFGIWEENGGTRILFQIYNSSNAATVNLFSTINVAVNQWYHIAAVKQGLTATLYINGAFAGSAALTAGGPGVNTEPLTIGRAPTLHTDFPGRLDEVSLHSRALTQAEIQGAYNAQNGTGIWLNTLTKTGAGSLTLAGTNSYPGATTVNGGTLLVNGAIASGSAAVNVNNAGSALGGTGTINRAVNVNSGAALAPGAATGVTTGVLHTTAATAFVGGASLNVEIGGTPASGLFDQHHATGSVNLAGATLNVSLVSGFVPTNGQTFVIVKNDAAGSPGTFAGIPEGGSISAGGATFKVSYNYNADTNTPGTGYDVALTADTPSVQFGAPSYSVSEGVGLTMIVQLTRTGDLSFASQVQIAVTGGTATGGTVSPDDFVNDFPKTALFGIGAATSTFAITLIDDPNITDPGKNIVFTVTAVSNAVIGAQNTTTLNILDNDNALPTANAGGPYTVPEGGSVTLSGAASTDSDGTIVLYEWDLDDNGSYEVSSTSPTTSFNAATLGFDGLTPPNARTVRLRVTDNQGGLGTTTATVNVTNVNPTINTFTVPSPRLEGGTVIGSAAATDAAGALDPLTYTWTVSGPGIVGSLVFTGTSFSTAAIDNGSYSVSLTVSDGDGGSATQATSVVVNNVAPDFELGADETLPLNVGSFSRPGLSFTDLGAADTWTATVNYGDGSGTVPLPLSGMNFSLAHNYVTPTTYTVTVVITDDDLGSHTDSFTVTVQAPTVVYVDDAWASFTLGDTVVDADPVAGGNQAAVYGFNAHALPNAAVSAVAVGGTVYNNAGDYDEAAVVNKTVSYVFQEGPISIGSFGDSGPGGNSTYSLGVALTVGDNDGASTLTGPVSGAGSLTKVGSGVMTLAGTIANSYSGGTFVSEGTLALNKTAGVDGVAGPITIGTGAVGGVVKTAILRVDQSDQIPDAAAITFSGGDGRLFLASGSETIANPAALAAGDIKIAGSLTLTSAFTQTAGSSVTMAGGSLRIGTAGTFGGVDDYSLAGTLQGSGTIYTKLLTSTGTIDPSSGATEASLGNATPGRINIRGNLQLTGSAVTNLDIGAASSDQLNVGINVGLPLPAGSYTNLSNYELDPYLRGDVVAVTEPGRRGVNDLYNVNGTVRLDGTLNTRPIIGSTPTATAATMNFVWRALNLPPGNLDPRGANLSSVPSDFAFRNSFTSAGVPVAPNAPSGNTRFEARFMGSAGQANAIGQSVNFMTKVGVVDQAVLSAPAYVVGQAKSLTLTPLTNVATSTANLRMTKQLWNAMKDSHTRVTVTVTNTTGGTLTGPFYLEITSVTGNSPVFNQAGKTQVNNKPYLVIVPRDAAGNALSTLANGATATVEVDLLTPIVQGKTAALTANVLFGGLP